ncbi:MAG: protein kinase [Chloracidobacterium sp.]|nr:protein kinase [Chloracidobacterium sp.]
MVCPNCGKVSDGYRFCDRCGTELTPRLDLAPASDDVTLLGAISQPSDSGAGAGAGAGALTGRTSPGAISQHLDSGALTGRTLDQKYYLESKLGAGAMGTVYRAARLLIGDWVAVKVLHTDQLTDPQTVERFRREAQIGARLKHPNIITVNDFVFSNDGLSYLVMGLAEGEDLGSLIKRQGPLAELDAAEIILQVCAALDEAHRQGMAHRDIKPQNIIVETTPEGLQVKVLDFGAAASREGTTSKMTRTNAVLGTPHYMSPELCLGEDLDGRSDIYSLGVVLFEMLTGVTPFDSPSPTAIVIKHVNDSPPSPRALNPNISPAVGSLVLRTLEKRREARPQTAGEMARELIAATAGVEFSSPSPALVAAPEIITPSPVKTHLSKRVVTTESKKVIAPESKKMVAIESKKIIATESRKSAVVTLDGATSYGRAFTKIGLSGKRVLSVFGALILLTVGGLGIWWYAQKSANENVAARDSAGNSKLDSTRSDQPATPGRNATASHSAAQTAPIAIGNKLWELIPDQTTGVSNAINALGLADRRMAVIDPGGQLALDYREGKFFGDGQGADLLVYGPERGQGSYIVYVRNDPAENWKRIDINRKGFIRGEAGHDMGHHGVKQARQVMIRNIGETDLRIDAVSVVYKDGVFNDITARPPH